MVRAGRRGCRRDLAFVHILDIRWNDAMSTKPPLRLFVRQSDEHVIHVCERRLGQRCGGEARRVRAGFLSAKANRGRS